MGFNIFKTATMVRANELTRLLKEAKFLKAYNFVLANANMVFKPEYANNYPIILVIDPSNTCNLKCRLCITGIGKNIRKKQFLSFKNFKKILDVLGPRAVKLDLFNWGEPFLNPDIFKMIKYAGKYKLQITVSSNLNYFPPKFAQKIINAGLHRIIISLHGASQKTYSKYSRGGNFEKVMKNIKLLVEEKKLRGKKDPEIVWRFLVTKDNQRELKKASLYSKNLGLDIFEPIPIKLGAGLNPRQFSRSVTKEYDFLPGDKNYRLYNKKAPRSTTRSCFWPWEIVTIEPDGNIQPCCVYEDPKFDFGNIFTTPFGKIWNGEKYIMARKAIKKNLKNNTDTICGLCVASGYLAR